MTVEALQYRGVDRQIVDGERVAASIANRPHTDLRSDVTYLKTVLDTIQAGKALVLYNQPMSGSVVAGNPVYLDTDNTWKQALAEFESVSGSALFSFTKKAVVGGIVVAKSSNTYGNIAILGEVEISEDTLDSVLEGEYAPGLFYLSANDAGKITASRGVGTLRVCSIHGPTSTGTYRVFVNPESRQYVENHSHYRFTLTDRPAGDANCVPAKEGFLWGELEPDGPYPGIVHVVENADSTKSGWLPITDPIFAGMTIPAGAKFGYNISQDSVLSAAWPPYPTSSAYVEVDGVGETDNRVIVNSDGIWWMDDTYGRAPWPVNLACPENVSSLSLDNSASSADYYDTYPIWPVRIELWYNRVVQETNLTGLTQLIEQTVGFNPSYSPVYVSGSITDALTTGGIPVKVLAAGATGVMKYTLPARTFLNGTGARISTVRFSVEFDLYASGSSSSSSSSSASLTVDTSSTELLKAISALTAAYITVPAVGNDNIEVLDIDSLSPIALTWEERPSPVIIAANYRYVVKLATNAIAVDPDSVIALTLTWNGAALSSDVRLITFRPIVTVL